MRVSSVRTFTPVMSMSNSATGVVLVNGSDSHNFLPSPQTAKSTWPNGLAPSLKPTEPLNRRNSPPGTKLTRHDPCSFCGGCMEIPYLYCFFCTTIGILRSSPLPPMPSFHGPGLYANHVSTLR